MGIRTGEVTGDAWQHVPDLGCALERLSVILTLGEPRAKCAFSLRRLARTLQPGEPTRRFGLNRGAVSGTHHPSIHFMRTRVARATFFSTALTDRPSASAISLKLRPSMRRINKIRRTASERVAMPCCR